MCDDDLAYRAAMLVGRSRALTEMSALMDRLGRDIDLDADVEATLHILLASLMQVSAWLDQAGLEAEAELKLLDLERKRALS